VQKDINTHTQNFVASHKLDFFRVQLKFAFRIRPLRAFLPISDILYEKKCIV